MSKVELIEIKSEYISAKISTQGAELKSLLDLDSSVEYLWQGKKAIYPWSSQIMFPVVGKLKDDQYRLGRKVYRLIKNGFAKDLTFEVKYKRKDEVSFILAHDQDTLVCFPYRFNFIVTFRVYGPRLQISFEVRNLDKKEMFFSLGFAPVLNIPLTNERYEDYSLELSNLEERGCYYFDNELINFNHTDNKKMIEKRDIAFNDETFKSGEFLFKDLISSNITYKNSINEKSVFIDFKSASYLSIWSYPGAPFLRIAPAFGVADAVDSNGDFYMKEGLIDLEQEKTFNYDIEIHIR